jgi:hypothetical protein
MDENCQCSGVVVGFVLEKMVVLVKEPRLSKGDGQTSFIHLTCASNHPN